MLTIHACFLDKECRDIGAPPRLYLNTKNHGSLYFELWRVDFIKPYKERVNELKTK